MRKHCGNCANHNKETNQFSEECGKCVSARLKNGETTDPSHWKAKPQTNADRVRAMSDEELAEFIMLSPEMEFGVCEYCRVFRGHGAYTPCGTENGWCTAELRCDAFKKWLQQPVEGDHETV